MLIAFPFVPPPPSLAQICTSVHLAYSVSGTKERLVLEYRLSNVLIRQLIYREQLGSRQMEPEIKNRDPHYQDHVRRSRREMAVPNLSGSDSQPNQTDDRWRL